jgi:two-component system, LytTR family, sensor kinase
MSRKYRNVVLHAAAWLLFLLYEWIFKQGVLNNPETSVFHLKIVAIRVLVLIPAVYFTLYYLVPRFLLKGQRLLFTGMLIATLAADTFVMKTLNYFLVLQGMEGFAPTYLKSISGITGWLIFMGNIAFNISFALMFYFINKWVRDDKKRQELETANKDAELRLLKSQVQPHFLFNTLNNIYALSKKNSPHTTEMIYRLSGLLEYMLYDSNREWTPLAREIAYIQHYLEIEKIRYGNRLDVSFTTFGNLEDLQVPPLVLLPFVENSFKHGLSQQTDGCWLRIEISYEAPWLFMKVENSKPESEGVEIKKGGLGILNVRKRLDILLEDRFELKQLDAPDSYLVTLKLQPKQKEPTYEKSSRPVEVYHS